MHKTPSRLARALGACLGAGLLLLPSAGAAAGPTTAARHADQTVRHANRTVRHDVSFVAMLLPHHQMAVEMATVARDKATQPQVRRLAAHIADEQSDQVTQMRVWLRQRNAQPDPPPAPVQEMGRQDLQMLRESRGVEVDRMFLMMMRPHHAQGVSESEDELKHGRNTFALTLARTNKADQLREIAQMNDLLATELA